LGQNQSKSINLRIGVHTLYNVILPVVIAAAISYAMTPLVIKLAHSIGAIDVPKDNRRVHSTPIPRLGGIAIYVAFMITYLSLNSLSGIREVGLVLGSLVIVAAGIVDDLKPISAKVKLAAQILAAAILYYSGIRIDFLTNYIRPSEMVDLGFMSLPMTVFWIVGITNTVNLIDGLDGLAAGISTIAAASLAYVALINGRTETALVTLAIVGACAGFLPYNFNPAKIFMGDTGSLFLGFILAATAIDGSIKGATFIVFAAPILALGVPIFDTTFAILRRMVNRKPIMEADKGHLHHRFLSLGFDQKTAVAMMYLISMLFGVSAILLIQGNFVIMSVTIFSAAMLILVPINKTTDRLRDEEDEEDSEVEKESEVGKDNMGNGATQISKENHEEDLK
jgi:UDP-GlcNAc:undecaprenyl-phosphate GlcNAc-1-phosphate transferase